MESDLRDQQSHPGRPSRRTVVVGAAWAAPVIAAVTAAPVFAASRAPGLQGWVQLQKSCDKKDKKTGRVTITGVGSYPDRGLWVFDSNPSTQITDASIVFYFDQALTFQVGSGNNGWSLPTVDKSAPQISGFTAYRTTYSGSFTYDTKNQLWIASGAPSFYATLDSCGKTLNSYAHRYVTVNGQSVDFLRGPITL